MITASQNCYKALLADPVVMEKIDFTGIFLVFKISVYSLLSILLYTSTNFH